MIPEEIGFSTEAIILEVSDKIADFENIHKDKISSVHSAWNQYKGKPSEQKKRETDGLANTFVYESPRIVDSLTTTQFRMMMAADPPFEIRSQRGDIPEDVLYRLSAFDEKKLEWIQYPKNLFRALKSCNLMGTVIVEQPFLQGPIVGGTPTWEATGFIPRPLNQIFFAPNALDIELADYIGTLDLVTNFRLHKLMLSDTNQEGWIHSGIMAAIDEDLDGIPAEVRTRLTSAGYRDFKGIKELAVYRGPLESQNSFEEWSVGLVNRRHLVKFHKPVLPERNFRVAYSSWVEQEPFGYGIKDYDLLQRMMNANRNRLFDYITMMLYGMFKVDRFAGLDVREARLRPWHFLFMDNINGMEQMRPDPSAIPHGINLEAMLKEEMRSRNFVTKNMQSVETDITATEVNVLMDESMRKIGVDTQLLAEPLLRQPLYYSHSMDELFIDRQIWIAATGSAPVSISPEDMAHKIDYKIKIVTDKDFRPNKLRRLIEFLQLLTSVRNDLPEEARAIILPIIQQGARLLDVDPRLMRSSPPPQQNLGDALGRAFQAQNARLALLNKEAGMFGQPSPLMGSPETPLPQFR